MTATLAQLEREFAALQTTQTSTADVSNIAARQSATMNRTQLEGQLARGLKRIEEATADVAVMQRKLDGLNAALRGGGEEGFQRAHDRKWLAEEVRKRTEHIEGLMKRAKRDNAHAQPRINMWRLIEGGMSEADAQRLAKLDEEAAVSKEAAERETVTIVDPAVTP